MNRKTTGRRSIAGFDKVSKSSGEPIAEEVQEAPQEVQEIDGKERSGILAAKMKGKKFVDTHTQRGLWLDNDLDKILTKYAKKGGHGFKTEVVNEALRRLFEQEGWK